VKSIKSSIELLRENFSYIAGFSEAPKGRLKNIGNIIFKTIYPKAIPFPFDGFASQSGGGAGDAAVLIRGLVTQQVHGQWVQSQVKKLQNRIDSLLVSSWKALLPSGKISKPSGKAIKEVFTDLEESHKKNPKKTLLDSYDELIKPPYGMNSSSAGIFLGLLLGIENPPRRIEFEKQMIPAGEWLKYALLDQKVKNQFDIKTLQKTTIRFLSEDSTSRWKTLLSKWEEATEYLAIRSIFQEAEKMLTIDPIPESLEGNYKYLKDKSIEVEEKILQKQKQIKFIWILVLSLIAFVIGLLLSWMFRHKPHRIFSFSILFIGIFGILYAIAYKLNTLPGIDKTLIFISVLAFITFVMLGIVFDVVTKQRGGKEPATIGEFFSNDYNYKPVPETM
jgi:hypothetical protein